MMEIFQKFKKTEGLLNVNLYFLYEGNQIVNEQLTFIELF